MDKYNVGFPDPNAHPNDKAKSAWGLQVAKTVWDLGNYNNVFSPDQRNDRFAKNELLSQGLQGQKQYKKIFGDKQGNVNFMFMFWKETNPFPKYIRSVRKMLSGEKFKPIATSLDITSQTEKDKAYAKMKGNLMLRKAEETVFKDTGIKFTSPMDYVPASFEEIELRKNLGFKASLEIAQEIGISTVMANNQHAKQEQKAAHDIAVKQWLCGEVFYDHNGDIRYEVFGPSDLLVPYSEDGYFDNRPWTARRKRITINELRMINQEEGEVYSDWDLFKLAEGNALKNNNPSWNSRSYNQHNRNQRWNTFMVEVMCYEFNTVNDYVWQVKERANGGKGFGKVSPKAKDRKSSKKSLIKKERQVWYDGVWVIGSEKLLSHKLRSNMVFEGGPNFYDHTPESRFVLVAPELYEMRNKALPEAAEPYIDRMHTAMLKFQQLLNEISPPTKAVDINALKGVIKGLGVKGGKPMDIFKIEKQIGVLFYNGKEVMTGEANNQNPVRELPSDIRNRMLAIQEAYNTSLSALENEVGVNDVLVGMPRNQYEGMGSRQQKEEAGLRALSHLQDGYHYFWDKVINVISIMLQDSLVRGDAKYIKGWENAIGRTNIDMIKLMGRKTPAEVGIRLEMLPTKADLERLDIELERCLQRDTIRVEDADMVRRIAKENYKIAWQFMTLKRKEYLDERMAESQNAAQANGAQQQQSNQVAGEQQRQLEILRSDLEKDREEHKKMLEEVNQQAEHLDNLDEEDRKGEWKMKHIQEANAQSLDKTESPNDAVKQPSVYPSGVSQN